MSTDDNPVLVYTTCPNMEAAERIGGELVERRLAACANILPAMRAIFIWQGKRQSEDETVLLLKTRRSHAQTVLDEIERLHPYETPAAFVLNVELAAKAFADWIVEETA